MTVFGRPPADWGGDYYERIGVGFEFPNHFAKLTGRENLAYFAALYRGPVRAPDELLAEVGLDGDGATPVGQYSKGMKVRLGVARALLNRPGSALPRRAHRRASTRSTPAGSRT